MNFQKAWAFGVGVITMVGLNFSGCVDVVVNTPTIPEAPPYTEQTSLPVPIEHLSRFENSATEIRRDEVQTILNHASWIVKCGQDNEEDILKCAQEFSDMVDDFGCKINFELDDAISGLSSSWPPVFTFPSPGFSEEEDPLNCLADGVICSGADLNRVWGNPPANDGIKIVKEILFCGEKFEDGWAGCAQFPEQGKAIAVARDPNKDLKWEATLWVHEFGHTRGLEHTPNRFSKDPNAAMQPTVYVSHTKFKRRECFKLRGGQP